MTVLDQQSQLDKSASEKPKSMTVGFYRRLFVLCACLTIVFGVAKVQMLRKYPPEYAQKVGNSYEGFVSGDNYSLRAAYIKEWLQGDDPGGKRLRKFLSKDAHPNSILVPSLVGATAILTKSIPWTFVAWASLALLIQALLVVHVARFSLGPEIDPDSAVSPWGLGALFLGHCLAMRTASQLHLDPFCGALMLGTVAISLRLTTNSSKTTPLALFLVQMMGAFTKASFLPALAMPAIIVGWRQRSWSRFFIAAFVYGVIPMALMLLFVELVPGRKSVGRDFGRFLEAWQLSPKELLHFAVEMVLLFQFWPIVLFVRRQRLGGGALVLACALLVLLATWAFNLPAVPRLYLPVLGLGLAGMGCAVSELLLSRRAGQAVLVVILANYLVATWGTFGFLMKA